MLEVARAVLAFDDLGGAIVSADALDELVVRLAVAFRDEDVGSSFQVSRRFPQGAAGKKALGPEWLPSIHQDDVEAVSQAIRDHAGYALMPEWGTHPANHYLPRRKTRIKIHEDELERVDNPLKKERQQPKPGLDEPTLDDVTSW